MLLNKDKSGGYGAVSVMFPIIQACQHSLWGFILYTLIVINSIALVSVEQLIDMSPHQALNHSC